LASRVKRSPPLQRDTATLMGILRSASASTATLASALAKEGTAVRIAWQSLFTQRVGPLDPDGAASSPLAGAVLAILREALATRAAGARSCEAGPDSVRAGVRFVRQAERWVLHEIIEDAPVARAAAIASA